MYLQEDTNLQTVLKGTNLQTVLKDTNLQTVLKDTNLQTFLEDTRVSPKPIFKHTDILPVAAKENGLMNIKRIILVVIIVILTRTKAKSHAAVLKKKHPHQTVK